MGIPIKTFLSGLVLFSATTCPFALAQDKTTSPGLLALSRYQEVTKWAITYDDRILGPVRGVAYCNWLPPRSWRGTKCHVRLRNPQTGALNDLWSDDVQLTPNEEGVVRVKLHGYDPFFNEQLGPRILPSAAPATAPAKPPLQITESAGQAAEIIIKNGAVEAHIYAPVWKSARPSKNEVDVSLEPQPDGSLIGTWSYFADPLTERDAGGGGRVGVFSTISDDEVHWKEGQDILAGFLGQQRGGEKWQPLPPRIVKALVLEDESAFQGASAIFTRPKSQEGWIPKNQRTLVIVGQDLPVDGRALVPIRRFDQPTLPDYPQYMNYREVGAPYYEIRAIAGNPDNSDAEKAQFERAWTELTRGMDATTAAAFRKLDAVLVRVFVEASMSNVAEPGPQKFVWGGGEGTWDLQYGDNTAALRFVRLLNKQESETVQQLALPDQVAVEVEIGNKELRLDSIPVQIGGAGVTGSPIDLIATRVARHSTLFRTPPITLIGADATSTASSGGAVLVVVRKGSSVLAAVNRARTNFIRASVASAVASEPTTLWLNALHRATSCNSVNVIDASWPQFARQAAEHVSRKFQGVDITYGDHAAMLILRDAFTQALRVKLMEYNTADKNDPENRFIDAWYEVMHDPVTMITDYPLATAKVASPIGQVPFSEAYSEDFKETNFHPSTTANGNDQYLKWRRQASREAQAFLQQTMTEALAKAEEIADCDRLELLKLTGSGFRNIAGRITPLVMKYLAGATLSEPDFLARAYIKNVDVLADRVRAIKEFSSQVNTSLVAAALVLFPPAAGAAWAAGGAVGAEAIGTLTGLIGGLIVTSYESAHEIYQTSQEHDEVRFAFGASAALGLDRYFDAESRQTPWWKTGVSIFGKVLLQNVAVRASGKTLSEGLSAWRGSRILANLPEGATGSIYRAGGNLANLGALRNLTFEEERDVAMFLLKEQERIARVGVFGQARQFADRIFRSLGRQAAGLPAQAEAPVLSIELEAQALNPIDDFKTAVLTPLDPLKATETEAMAISLLQVARTEIPQWVLAEAAEAAEASAAATKAPSVQEIVPSVPKPWPKGAGLPVPKEPWTKVINGKSYTFEIESFIDAGLFMWVYKLKAPPAGLALDAPVGTDVVLKILRDPKLYADFEIKVPGISQGIIARMIYGSKLLTRHNIPQAEFTAFEDAGILIQKNINLQDGVVEFYPKFNRFMADKAAFYAKIGSEKQRAVAELFNKISDAELSFLDSHGGNIYLEKTADGWVAKILDQDFICRFDEVNEGVYGRLLQYIKERKFAWSARSYNAVPGDLMYSTPRSMMQKLMEHQGWLEFNDTLGGLTNSRLDPQEVKKVMKDLLYVLPPMSTSGRLAHARRPYQGE